MISIQSTDRPNADSSTVSGNLDQQRLVPQERAWNAQVQRPKRRLDVESDRTLLGRLARQEKKTASTPPKVGESRIYALIGQMLTNERKTLAAWAGTHPDIRKALRNDSACEEVMAPVRWGAHVAPKMRDAYPSRYQRQDDDSFKKYDRYLYFGLFLSSYLATAATFVSLMFYHDRDSEYHCDLNNNFVGPGGSETCKSNYLIFGSTALGPSLVALGVFSTAFHMLEAYRDRCETGDQRRIATALLEQGLRPSHLDASQRQAVFGVAQSLGAPSSLRDTSALPFGEARWLAVAVAPYLKLQENGPRDKSINEGLCVKALEWLGPHVAPADREKLVLLFTQLSDKARADLAGTMHGLQSVLTPEQNRTVSDAIESIRDPET